MQKLLKLKQSSCLPWAVRGAAHSSI